MPATIEKRHSAYRQLRSDNHPGCVVCCPSNGHGLGLEFRIACDGAVEASDELLFVVDPDYEADLAHYLSPRGRAALVDARG